MNTRSLALAICGVVLLCCAAIQTGAQDKGDTLYVKVDDSSPDAVVQSSTDFFDTEPVGTLIPNQPVTLLGETDGEYVKIRCKINGKEVEGWVKMDILQRQPLENSPRVAESGEDDSARYYSDHWIADPEDDLRRNSQEFHDNLNRVDELEEFLNSELGGDPRDPNPQQMVNNVRSFADQGGLSRGSMK